MDRIRKALERAKQEGATASLANQSRAGGRRAEPSAKIGEGPIAYSRTRVVAVDPAVFARNRIVLGQEFDEAGTAYKILRTQVEQRLSAKGWNSLAVTSPASGQGKTLTAINLSIALAREMHRTVLLVDLDLRNPCIDRYFGLEPQRGLVDFLLDSAPLGDLLVNPGIDRLVVLPAGRSVPFSSELIASPKMASLVDELKSRYPSRIVVFDLPPLLAVDDALAFSPYVDATLLVIDDGRTKREDLSRAMELLEGVQVLGTVLNRATERPTVYRYR